MKNNLINYCKVCLNHPGFFKKKVFEKIRSKPDQLKKGICNVCRFEILKKKNKINWNKRNKILKNIASWAKKNKSSSYDCIVPVSGGKDSLWQAIHVRDVLKMNPLLVTCTYPPEQLSAPPHRTSQVENGPPERQAVT